MRVLAFLLALAVSGGVASAAPADDLVPAAQAFLDAFNTLNGKALAATCTSQAAIVDDFAPFVWNSCADWYKDFVAYAAAQHFTENIVKHAKPWAAQIDGDRGYLVLPTSYTWNDHGKPQSMTGAVWTLSFKKIGGAWKITGWAWADH
jgi:hypothetical protein